MKPNKDKKKEKPKVNDISSDDESFKEESLSYKYNHGDIEFPSKDLECLRDGQYLKDSIIQFYLAYLLNGCKNPKRIHIFDIMFMQRLEAIYGDEQEIKPVSERKQLNKWFNNIDIFSKDFIIFPICSENHWFVIIACYPGFVKTFKEFYDNVQTSENNEDNPPGIFVMDSLGMKQKKFPPIIRDFFDFEWRNRPKEIKRFGVLDMPAYYPNLPHQTNNYDCGIYALAYVSAFLKSPDTFYRLVRGCQSESKPDLESKIEKNLSLVTRKSITNLINQMCVKNS